MSSIATCRVSPVGNASYFKDEVSVDPKFRNAVADWKSHLPDTPEMGRKHNFLKSLISKELKPCYSETQFKDGVESKIHNVAGKALVAGRMGGLKDSKISYEVLANYLAKVVFSDNPTKEVVGRREAVEVRQESDELRYPSPEDADKSRLMKVFGDEKRELEKMENQVEKAFDEYNGIRNKPSWLVDKMEFELEGRRELVGAVNDYLPVRKDTDNSSLKITIDHMRSLIATDKSLVDIFNDYLAKNKFEIDKSEIIKAPFKSSILNGDVPANTSTDEACAWISQLMHDASDGNKYKPEFVLKRAGVKEKINELLAYVQAKDIDKDDGCGCYELLVGLSDLGVSSLALSKVLQEVDAREMGVEGSENNDPQKGLVPVPAVVVLEGPGTVVNHSSKDRTPKGVSPDGTLRFHYEGPFVNMGNVLGPNEKVSIMKSGDPNVKWVSIDDARKNKDCQVWATHLAVAVDGVLTSRPPSDTAITQSGFCKAYYGDSEVQGRYGLPSYR